MHRINTKRDNCGNTLAQYILLILLLAGLGIAVEYQIGIPGTTVVDRLRAKPVVIDLDLLNGKDDPQKIKQSYHYLHHICAPESGTLGDAVCWAPISKFNGIDARVIAFFFRNGELSAVRVSFPANRHTELFSSLHKRYGQEHNFGPPADNHGINIVGWIRLNGIVSTIDRAETSHETIVLWVSKSKVVTDAFKLTLPGY
jgi:hypothetical protein